MLYDVLDLLTCSGLMPFLAAVSRRGSALTVPAWQFFSVSIRYASMTFLAIFISQEHVDVLA